MLQYVTTVFLGRALLQVLLVFFVVRFDRVYLQRDIMFRRDFPQKFFWLHRKAIMDVFLMILYMIWMVYHLYYLVPAFIGGGSLSERPSHSPILDQLFFFSSIVIYLLLGIFFMWSTFRSYIMSKLHLDPQRYVHCIMVWWMLSCVTYSIYFRYFQPVTMYDHWDRITNHIFSFILGCKEVLLTVLAVGWGVSRNWRKVLARLGMNNKPTIMGFLWTCVLGTVYILFNLLIYKFLYISYSSGQFVRPSIDWLSSVLIMVIPAIGEELFFRGALQPRVGIWITSILFTIIHFQYNWFGTLSIFLVSLIYGWLASRYSIWLSIGLHMYNNWLSV
ncbi:CPBP family intramembrane glutamic endopeptidase [Pasteuria penetrans]|uniref:CPBP family intramembrane glutamic endopeptidase n=1 Tax=Pasteuria penetrans TaxID=86005 RepID=UPI000F9304A7